MGSFLSYSATSVQNTILPPLPFLIINAPSTFYCLEKREWWDGLPESLKGFALDLAITHIAGVLMFWVAL